MKRLLLPLQLLAACEPAEPTAVQVAEKLQVQINELLKRSTRASKRWQTLTLMACVQQRQDHCRMDLLVPRYRAFAVLKEELGDMKQALLAGGAANQFSGCPKIRRDCTTRVAASIST